MSGYPRVPISISDSMRRRALAQLMPNERNSIYSFVKKLERLDRGEIAPKGDKQRQFLYVCRGKNGPSELYEIAYLKYRSKLVASQAEIYNRKNKDIPDKSTKKSRQHSAKSQSANSSSSQRMTSTNLDLIDTSKPTNTLRPSWMSKRSLENAKKIKQNDDIYGDNNVERMPRPGFEALKKYQ